MIVLITGATSFLGAAVTRSLLRRGHRVYALVRPGSKNRAQLPQHERLSCIDCAMEEVTRLPGLPGMPKRIDCCLHFAWSGVGVQGRMNPEIQAENVRATLTLLRALSEISCGCFLFAGSQAEYGVTLERVREGSCSGGAVTEAAHCRPVSEYGKAKLRVLNDGSALAAACGIRYVHMRIFSVYGPGDHESSLVSACVRAAEGGEITLGPCAQQWNFLYVEDCAEAVALLAERSAGGSVPGRAEDSAQEKAEAVYNIGSWDTRQLKDFVREIFMQLPQERRGRCRFAERPAGPEGTPYLCPDTEKLRRRTGWCERHSFSEGIGIMLNVQRGDTGC